MATQEEVEKLLASANNQDPLIPPCLKGDILAAQPPLLNQEHPKNQVISSLSDLVNRNGLPTCEELPHNTLGQEPTGNDDDFNLDDYSFSMDPSEQGASTQELIDKIFFNDDVVKNIMPSNIAETSASDKCESIGTQTPETDPLKENTPSKKEAPSVDYSALFNPEFKEFDTNDLFKVDGLSGQTYSRDENDTPNSLLYEIKDDERLMSSARKIQKTDHASRSVQAIDTNADDTESVGNETDNCDIKANRNCARKIQKTDHASRSVQASVLNADDTELVGCKTDNCDIKTSRNCDKKSSEIESV